MKPKARVEQAQRELFRVELEQLVDAGHLRWTPRVRQQGEES